MSAAYDLAVIGAGPAGLAAATQADALGMKVVLYDEQPAPGGQIYRGIESAGAKPQLLAVLGDDYAAGLDLVRRFRASAVAYHPQTSIWQVDGERRVYYRDANGVGSVAARQVLVATGAMERPMPIPGWTLPGVMTCGAAQTLLKSSGIVPDGRFVLAGSGPLLLLLASQLIRAGVKPTTVLETSANYFSALRHLPGFVGAPGYFVKGLSLIGALRRAGVRVVRGVTQLRIHGDERAKEIEYERRGQTHREPTDLVLLHQGIVPNGNLALSLRCDHAWDDLQRSFTPRLDAWGATSVPGVLIAGDTGGIVGAHASAFAGKIAALGAAFNAAKISAAERDRLAEPVRNERARHLRARPFLDALYRPAQPWVAPLDPETIVCRCEEIRAGEIRALVTEQACPGPNQMKAFTRCGMGPCQGRLCGLTVVELIAECRDVPASEVGYYRIRSPVKPVTVGELATLGDS